MLLITASAAGTLPLCNRHGRDLMYSDLFRVSWVLGVIDAALTIAGANTIFVASHVTLHF